ncbi:MAG TPA: hypothetical protein DCS93_32185 [Microscillaceae bacterium]|nr:hypothetical protein [Microscillaceae bacterium]
MKNNLCFYLFLIGLLCTQTLLAQEQGVETRRDSTKTDTAATKQNKEITGPRFLALDVHRRFGKVRRFRFYRGNSFEFKVKGSKERFETKIESVGKTQLGILGGNLPLENIDKVYVRNPGWFIHSGSVLLPIAGLGYFALDMLNPAVDDNPGSKPFTVHREAVIISGSLILTGIILRFFKKRVFKINKRRILRPMIKF